MKRLTISLLILALLSGFCLWWFSSTQVVKRKTLSLLETLTMASDEGKAKRHMGSYSLNSLLAPQIEFETPTIDQANGSFERDEIDAAFSWLCEQAKQTRFEMKKWQDISIQGEKATVKFDLTGVVELPTYRPADGDYRVTFD